MNGDLTRLLREYRVYHRRNSRLGMVKGTLIFIGIPALFVAAFFTVATWPMTLLLWVPVASLIGWTWGMFSRPRT